MNVLCIYRYIIFVFIMLPTATIGQPVGTKYDYVEAFNSAFYQNNGNEYRSASGRPGAKYWQNRTDYIIKATLNPTNNLIKVKTRLIYTNNSPDKLDFIWLQLDQNLFNSKSRGQLAISSYSRFGNSQSTFDGGYHIASVKSEGKDIDYEITDTRMQVHLPSLLRANGGKVIIDIECSFVLPANGADRCGIQETKYGKIFSVAQWFPRTCVYDDISGWNTLPYTGPGEFYLEYGDYEVNITVPDGYFVFSGGELLNPREVYTQKQLDLFNIAKESDSTVIIRTKDEIVREFSTAENRKQKTWKFRLRNARDIAWACSPAFIIDACRINLEKANSILAISAYPMESCHNGKGWERSTEYVKSSVEHYSNKWFEYPYPVAINIASNVNGMEYPGIIFCNYESRYQRLWDVTDHEIGHTWFPMIVGTNERLHAWMDEGFNSFINKISAKVFNNGEYYWKGSDGHVQGEVNTRPSLEPVMTSPENLKEKHLGRLAYFKPSFGLHLLRNEIVGVERFDKAFKAYIKYWAYKHPGPDDFFRLFENITGENLGWFWKGWFKYNWQFDQGIRSVERKNYDSAYGVLITVDNLQKLPMPVVIDITTSSGKTTRLKFPVEIWQRSAEWKYWFATTEDVVSVVLDPEKVFPDIDPANNIWRKDTSIKPD